MTNTATDAKANTTSLYINDATCLLKEILELDGGTIVADLAIFSGSTKDKKQNFLNGSFVLPPRFKSLVGIYDNQVVKCDIANISVDVNDTYANFRGFVNKMSF